MKDGMPLEELVYTHYHGQHGDGGSASQTWHGLKVVTSKKQREAH